MAKSLPNATAGLTGRLGITFVETTGDRVVATMPVTPDHHQPLGYLHGGASVALAETVASIGAYFAAPEGYVAFGMEINANHLRPVRDGVLTAAATPIHRGRTTHVWGVEIRDEQGRLVCIVRTTIAVVPAPADGA